MLKAGLIGIGSMGRGHLEVYLRLAKEGVLDFVAACDINPDKFQNVKQDFNLKGVGEGALDFDSFRQYHSIDEMLEKESLDMVTIALPTYLHCEATVKCLERGVNVLCEKPMALSAEQCAEMIAASKRTGRRLMIGQCLRFWGQYEVLKQITVDGRYGAPIAGYFFRGGDTPMWSYNNWLQKRECGGGALLDQHVHDVDMVQYLFGMPTAVSSLARIVIPGSGYDTVTTQYYYPDHKAVNAQDDWVLSGGGFSMIFRVNFEKGSAVMNEKGFFIAGKDEKAYTPDYDPESAYYKETKYFARCLEKDLPFDINPPEASMNTLRIVMAEIESADRGGEIVTVR